MFACPASGSWEQRDAPQSAIRRESMKSMSVVPRPGSPEAFHAWLSRNPATKAYLWRNGSARKSMIRAYGLAIAAAVPKQRESTISSLVKRRAATKTEIAAALCEFDRAEGHCGCGDEWIDWADAAARVYAGRVGLKENEMIRYVCYWLAGLEHGLESVRPGCSPRRARVRRLV
jgi:hypothetical protein